VYASSPYNNKTHNKALFFHQGKIKGYRIKKDDLFEKFGGTGHSKEGNNVLHKGMNKSIEANQKTICTK